MHIEDIVWASATDLRAALDAGELDVATIAEAMIARIELVNPSINAFISFEPETIRRRAEELDEKKAAGNALGALFGVPYSIKMLTEMEGLDFSGGLLPFKDAVGKRDALVAQRMRQADGLFLGQTNAPEAGYYGGTTNHIYGQTHNPWKKGLTPGGSSGGAAAAVAAGLGPLAEGADGAGSVRIPAALSGTVGFKPSLGRSPNTLTPGRFYTFIFHGPLTRTVGDAALMLNVIAGESDQDPLSLPDPVVDYVDETKRSIEGWKIAYSETMGTGVYVDPEVRAICRDALSAFVEAGATVSDATPHWGQPESAMWNALWLPSYAREHDHLDWEDYHGKVDDNFIALMKETEMATAVDIGHADTFRGQMWDVFVEFMREYDLIVSPTLASAAFPVEQFEPEWLAGQSLQTRVLGWLLTYPLNLLTTPSITVPAGFTADGRPVGLQISGRLHADGDVLAAAARFEEARPWIDRRPDLPFTD